MQKVCATDGWGKLQRKFCDFPYLFPFGCVTGHCSETLQKEEEISCEKKIFRNLIPVHIRVLTRWCEI
ncbi:hypothetical protein CEXT_661461 [Caerostris extrusa]|uniref:Uncharacterized protein n=1 Tax=Caerostris extrusa TaxID=172846 RepID=A0AAV4PQ05_CAEEX|nr:hypothetical protein CEXT_661461 [Caerostris extrusa]